MSVTAFLGLVGTVVAAGLLVAAMGVLTATAGTWAADRGGAPPETGAMATQRDSADAPAVASQDQADRRIVYSYWAKLVCGIQKDPRDLRLAVGAYATTINIGNLGEAPVELTKSLALAIPPGSQEPGQVAEIATDKLPAGAALATDCDDIQRRLFPGGLPGPYIDGFVIIRSPAPLEVTGVYSTGSVDEKGNITGNGGIDIEPVAARVSRRPPPSLPDLIVSAIGPADVSCPNGGGSCVTKVDVTVANIGGSAAGPFDVRVVLDPAAAVVVTASSVGLAAGASQTFAIVTPAGGNCYDPDCTICATADSANAVSESDETNNQKCNTSIG
jgi:hypothetical protein